MAGDGSDDSQGCLLEGEEDVELAGLPPEQRGAVDTPCILEAAGAFKLREAGEKSELQAYDAIISDHNSYSDVERCVVLGGRISCRLHGYVRRILGL